MPDQIVIAEYDPMWPGEFERLRARAADVVGAVAVAIEHVGSTAVPGLAAKPVIDLVFPFGKAREAYEYLQSGQHFGKVVISVE